MNIQNKEISNQTNEYIKIQEASIENTAINEIDNLVQTAVEENNTMDNYMSFLHSDNNQDISKCWYSQPDFSLTIQDNFMTQYTSINKVYTQNDDNYFIQIKQKEDPVLVQKNNFGKLHEASYLNAFKASLKYSLRQILNEKRNFCIGTTIIMFSVCISAYIFIFFQNSPSLYFLLNQELIGDVDIMFLPNPDIKPSMYNGSESNQQANYSKYQDASSKNQQEQNPFFFINKKKIIKKESQIKTLSPQIQLPFVNSTHINYLLEQNFEQNGKQEKLKDLMNVKGAYPRWIIPGNLTNIDQLQEEKSIVSIIHLGDSKKENELNVAIGFPNDNLNDDEMIIPIEFSEYFGFKLSPKEAKQQNIIYSLNLTFDILSFAAQNNKKNMQLIDMIFDDNSKQNESEEEYQNEIKQNKGEKILEILGVNKDMKIRDLFEQQNLQTNDLNTILEKLSDAGLSQELKLSSVLNSIITRMKKQDFIFTREYKVKNQFKKARGKWPSVLQDSVFIDSTNFHKIYLNMLVDRIISKIKSDQQRFDFEKQQYFGTIPQLQYQIIQQILQIMKVQITQSNSNDYAVSCILKGINSAEQYLENPLWPVKSAEIFLIQDDIRHYVEKEYQIQTLLSQNVIKTKSVTGMYQNFVLLILLIMLILALIVSHSLISSSIEDKTYENGMLRCLGWNNKYIALITIQKTLMFQVIPGGILGLLLCQFFVIQTQEIVRSIALFDFKLNFSKDAIFLGIFIATFIPLVTMIHPLIQFLRIELRNALDTSRNNKNDLKFEFIKLQDSYGISIVQLIMGSLLLFYGIIAFIQIPSAIILKNQNAMFFWCTLIFIGLIFGMIVVSQMILPIVSFYIANYMCFISKYLFCNKRTKQVQLIAQKNLYAHFSRNSKTGIMIITIVMFMIFVNTICDQMSGIFFSQLQGMIGGDLQFKVNQLSNKIGKDLKNDDYHHLNKNIYQLDQESLIQILEKNKNEQDQRKRVVKNYEFIPHNMDKILNSNQFVLLNSHQALKVKISTVPQNHLSMFDNSQLVSKSMWKPEQQNLMNYQPHQIMDLMKDLENKSLTNYDYTRDSKQIINFSNLDDLNKTNIDREYYIQNDKEQQIINIILSESSRSYLDIDVGQDNLKICSINIHTCFKARVVMLASKFPGFYFSSYYFLNFITTEAIVSENQFKFIIKELTNQTIKDLPQEILNIQLNDAKLIENKEIMRFTSEIYSRIDKNRVWVLNYRAIKYKIEEMLQTMIIFVWVITGLLFMMSFFQLVVSVEGNLKDDLQQIGVLRSLGMRKSDIVSLVQIEAKANIASALLIGIVIGYIVAITGQSQMRTLFEQPYDYNISWSTIAILSAVCYFVVYFGTQIAVSYANSKKISSILKGQ